MKISFDMKWLGLLAIGALFAGTMACISDPIKREPTDNKSLQVDFLFEHEGCRAYRFQDGGEYVYYVNCGTKTQTSWERNYGKGEVHHFTVPTDAGS